MISCRSSPNPPLSPPPLELPTPSSALSNISTRYFTSRASLLKVQPPDWPSLLSYRAMHPSRQAAQPSATEPRRRLASLQSLLLDILKTRPGARFSGAVGGSRTISPSLSSLSLRLSTITTSPLDSYRLRPLYTITTSFLDSSASISIVTVRYLVLILDFVRGLENLFDSCLILQPLREPV